MKNIIVTVLLSAAIVLTGPACKKSVTTNDSSSSAAAPISNTGAATPTTFTFETPKKSAHYESNTPMHGSVLAAAPINVVIDFNFDLSTKSSVSITKDGKEYGTSATIVDDNKLAMRRTMDASAPDGMYAVKYTACWPDGSCHNGSFQFAIDRTRASSYNDLRNQSEAFVILSGLKFYPQEIRISKGTKVTWLNDDEVEHYINTDSHPAHTYFPEQNSRNLKKGDRYSATFSTAGAYPYHCSAHADVMHGYIVVE